MRSGKGRGRGEGCLNETLVLLNMIIDFVVPHSLPSSSRLCFQLFPQFIFNSISASSHNIFVVSHFFCCCSASSSAAPSTSSFSLLLLLVMIVVVVVVVVTSGTSKRQQTTTLIAAKSANAIGKCICICSCICSQCSYLCFVSFVSISRCELVIQPPPLPPPPTCSRYRFVPLQHAQYFI